MHLLAFLFATLALANAAIPAAEGSLAKREAEAKPAPAPVDANGPAIIARNTYKRNNGGSYDGWGGNGSGDSGGGSNSGGGGGGNGGGSNGGGNGGGNNDGGGGSSWGGGGRGSSGSGSGAGWRGGGGSWNGSGRGGRRGPYCNTGYTLTCCSGSEFDGYNGNAYVVQGCGGSYGNDVSGCADNSVWCCNSFHPFGAIDCSAPTWPDGY